MALTAGSRVGPYEVLAAIGQGGMGEVYRARDTKLGRDVALKILPDAFAYDPDRLARFQREAQVLASLSHPNIGGIYGLEDSGDTKALVLELVDGPTLADRIAQGPVPIEEALPIAQQIGDALEAAHNAGVIHRDLKPANIKLTPGGTVKVLDFGLAKIRDQGSGIGDQGSRTLSLSPTITTPAMTQVGFILGTAAYMSPEQAKGKQVDKRADIWAFGVVLFEMLAGSRPFAGDDVSDVLASVLAREPQLGVIADTVPAPVRQALKACLQKDPRKRIHDIADVRLAMDGAFETVRDGGSPVASARPSWRRVLATASAIVVVAAVAAGTAWILKPVEPRSVTRFSHRLNDEAFSRTGRPVLALTRDGRRLAYIADNQIYLRNLDEPDAKPIPGTDENPSSPFFSPDGEWVGFWSSDDGLKKIRLTGGTPVTLSKAGNPMGVSWGVDDRIVYALSDGIWSVSGNGSVPEHLVKTMPGERIHAPQMLPGGRALLFTSTTASGPQGWDQGRIVVQSLDGGRRTVLHEGGADPRYVPTGHLVYALSNTLFAIPFDVNALEVRGGPIPVVTEVRRAVGADIGIAQYAISDAGVLAHLVGTGVSESNLSLADRSGASKPFPGSTATMFHPRFNRDDSRIAVHRVEGGSPNIWIYEVPQSQWRQLTFDGGERPEWTPDGRAIAYRKGTSLWQVPSDFSGGGAPLPGTDLAGNLGPFGWSPNGDVLLWGAADGLRAYRAKAGAGDAADSAALLLKPPEGSSSIIRASFSADGRWLVSIAAAPAGNYVYVSPFPFGTGGYRKIMNESGNSPVWSRSGREIFLIATDGQFKALQISTNPAPDWGNPQSLFSLQGITSAASGTTNYDVTRDGRQFLFITPSDGAAVAANPEIQIVLNWHEELKRLAPVQ
jgi:eukaryotic-like serine/threonine-protein kinase